MGVLKEPFLMHPFIEESSSLLAPSRFPTTTMEEHLVKDMSELLFARGGVSFSPKELQSLQAMLRRKMGHADDAQERDVKDVGLDDRDPRQATLQIMDNDAKTKNLDLDLRLKEHIDSFLSEYDSQLEKLALNQIQIPLWKPDLPDLSDDLRQFIQDLKIPRARAPNDHLPDMLLHKLGRFQKNRNLRDRLKGLFDNKNHKVFVNTSGSGKTRMILEHLCSQWGIYLTCHKESRVGSSDLMIAISSIEQRVTDLPRPAILQVTPQQLAEYNDTIGDVSTEKQCLQAVLSVNNRLASFRASSEGVSFRKAIEANQKIVTSELQILMLARLTVLQRFISTLRRLGKDTRRMSHKRQWLYLQLHPELLLSRVEGKSKDIFTELIMHIAGVITQEGADAAVHDIILKELINGVLTELRDAVDYRLDTALDECQFTAQQLPSCFRSDDWTVNRPLLRQIARSLDIILNGNSHVTLVLGSFIFTGTGLSRDIITEALSSVVSKPGLTIEINATGAFNDATSQLEYMKELFPPEIWQDKEFEQVRRRIFYWLRGRHRFTAEYLSVVLQNGYQHLHKLLNVYIAKIADINPADYNGEVMEFGNVAWPPRGFAFEKLDAEMKERVKTMCHEYLFTSQLSADLGENEIRYVEYGLARFLQQGVIALDEPLVLLACSMWFNNQPKRCGTSLYQTLASRIRDHSPSTGRNGFEEFICFYLQHVFRKPRRLDEVFKFKGENKIGEKLATLVTLHINDYEEELRLIEGKINLVGRPSLFGPIGQITNELWEEGTSSLQDWIDLKSYTAFCFPMKIMGPDIMCFLKLQDPVASSKDFTYICLAIQCKFYDDLPRKTLSEAIATVTPNNFFQRRRQSNASTAQAIATQTTTDGKRNEARDRFLKTLLNFPRKDPLAGTYGVLRIICGFPVLVDLEKAFDVRVKDDKEEDAIKVKMVTKQTPDPDGTDGHPLASFNDSLLRSETRPFHPTNMLDLIIRRAYAAGDSLVLDQNSPGVIGISPPAVEPRRNKTGLQKAEAARKLAARHRIRGNIVHSSNLAVRKGRIVPQITEDVITMLRVDHAHWGERLNLKRKHDESVKR